MKTTLLKSAGKLAFVAGLLLMFSVSAMAQRVIRGKVTDDNGAPVTDARITIERTDSKQVFSGKTDKKGEYIQLLGSQPGIYRVVVRKDGFKPEFQANIRPELGEEVRVDFQLSPGSDSKLAFELTGEDRAQLQKKQASQEKNQKQSAEVRALFEQGVKLFNAEQFDEALEAFNKALEKDPKQTAIVARTGDCYLRLNKNDEALAAYNKAIEMAPSDAELYTLKGVVLSRMGQQEESQEMFKKAAELDPAGAAQNFYNLGITLFNSNHLQQAADAFKQSIASNANYAESYFQLGMSLVGIGDEAMTPEAVEAFKKYISLGGKKPDQVQIAKDMISALGG